MKKEKTTQEILPSNEFLLAQFLVATNIQFGDDILSAFLWIVFTLAFRLTNQIVLNIEKVKLSGKASKWILFLTMAEIRFVNSFWSIWPSPETSYLERWGWILLRRPSKFVYWHFEGYFKSIIQITLAGSSDGQEEFIEINRTIVVGIEGGEGVSKRPMNMDPRISVRDSLAEGICFASRIELFVNIDEFLLVEFAVGTITKKALCIQRK